MHAEAGHKPCPSSSALCSAEDTVPKVTRQMDREVPRGCPPSQPLQPTPQPLSRGQVCPTCPLTPVTPDLFIRLPARPEAGTGGRTEGRGPPGERRQAESRLNGWTTAVHQAAPSREQGLGDAPASLRPAAEDAAPKWSEHPAGRNLKPCCGHQACESRLLEGRSHRHSRAGAPGLAPQPLTG